MMTYEYINGTEMGDNLAYIFKYANDVTHQMFGLFMVIGFFLVVMITSVFAQFRFTGRVRPETSFLASSFVTLGFAVIIEQYSGILAPQYFFILIGLNIIGFIWVALSE